MNVWSSAGMMLIYSNVMLETKSFLLDRADADVFTYWDNCYLLQLKQFTRQYLMNA